jgi:hypothetical protein
MSSGARCEETLPGAALGGIAMSILISYTGNGGAKFSKRLGSYRKFGWIGVQFEHLRFQRARSLSQSLPIAIGENP